MYNNQIKISKTQNKKNYKFNKTKINKYNNFKNYSNNMMIYIINIVIKRYNLIFRLNRSKIYSQN